ncbi:hypothetical protein B0H19DRAFT_1078780 [Mycena capillaripes]|nr:hypothetical protein B0H19DRAFT_1078780 [Mycena capillaripes]
MQQGSVHGLEDIRLDSAANQHDLQLKNPETRSDTRQNNASSHRLHTNPSPADSEFLKRNVERGAAASGFARHSAQPWSLGLPGFACKRRTARSTANSARNDRAIFVASDQPWNYGMRDLLTTPRCTKDGVFEKREKPQLALGLGRFCFIIQAGADDDSG